MDRIGIAVLVTVWTLLSTMAAADRTNEVTFKLYRGYVIVVRGEIDGVRDLNFIVDTGAVPSVLDKRLASKLDLVGEAGELSVFTERVESRRAVARNVRLGPVQATELPVMIQDLSFAESVLGTRVDGMIGLDLLGQGPFTIDYESRKISFGPIDPTFTTIPYRPGLPYAMVDLDIQGRRLGILVDTGASDLVLFASALQNCLSSIKKTHSAAWSNLGGDVRVTEAQLTDARFGTLRWEERVVYILQDYKPPAGLGGILGMKSLRARRVAFDPDRRVVAWEPTYETEGDGMVFSRHLSHLFH